MGEKILSEIHSFVKRSGRISNNRKRLVAENREDFILSLPEEGKKLDFTQIFGNSNPVTIEIGFGMGDSPLYFIKKYPDRNLLGIEVHSPGVARLVSLLSGDDQGDVLNFKIIEHDAVEVLDRYIEDESISAFHIFFPDPWPKNRHHKRRLLQPIFIELLIRKLHPSGYICTATDWEEYGLEMFDLFQSIPQLTPKNPRGFSPRPDFRPLTRFEAKGIKKNHRIINLIYTKQE